jgi:TRAP-type C4-dicarboxylate transport system permease small subunit
MKSFNTVIKIHQFLLKTEAAITISLLVSMILFATVQIIMRNLFDSGFLWVESYIRIAVLWLALLGAMLASRHDKHLAMDVLRHRLSTTKQYWLKRVNDLFSASICFILSYYSVILVYSDYQAADIAFASIPNWLCEVIIPIAFASIGSRYLLATLFQGKLKS